MQTDLWCMWPLACASEIGEIELVYQDQIFVACALFSIWSPFCACIFVVLSVPWLLPYFLSLVMYLHCWQLTHYGQGQHVCVASECVAKCAIVATLMHSAWCRVLTEVQVIAYWPPHFEFQQAWCCSGKAEIAPLFVAAWLNYFSAVNSAPNSIKYGNLDGVLYFNSYTNNGMHKYISKGVHPSIIY